MIDFDAINSAALSRGDGLIETWLPGGKFSGDEYTVRNPTRNDQHPGSFKINRKNFRWSDFATGDGGGDPVSLFAYVHGLDQGEAAHRLAEEFGLNGYHANGGRPDAARAGRKPSLTIEELAQAKGLPLDFLKKHGVEQSGRFVKFTYYGADGGPAPRYRLRQKLTGKNKTIWNPKDKRPIGPYGAETLRPGPSAVLDLVEGETDRLSALLHGRNALGLPGASTARLIQAEHLAGFDGVAIYQEPDTGGPTLRCGILKRLRELGFRGTVKVIHMPADVKDLNGLHVRWLGEPGAFEAELDDLLRSAETVKTDVVDEAEDEAAPPEFSEDQLALRFADLHCRDLRYVASWAQWQRWRGARWAGDDTLEIFDMARSICRTSAAKLIATAQDPARAQRAAATIASAKTVAAVASLARSDRRIAATTSQWDVDLFVLNTPAGPIDLRSGGLRMPRREDYLTKATAVAPAEKATCSRWIEALGEIFEGDNALVDFLQRALGYSLTGDVSEQVLFFLIGPGGNGKNVVVETVKGLLGEYAVAAPMGLLLEQRHEQHPTEIACLRGARMALVSEISAGQAWAEAKLKSLTGGDRVTARFMRGDFFEFDPTFKFWVRANSRPRLRSVDPAMKRRLYLIPFRVKFEGPRRDTALPAKLREEWPGILRWMIEGCLAWQRDGLNPPASVSDTTASYFVDADTFDRWLDELCERDPNARTFTRPLFRSWSGWAEQNKERVGSEVEFVDRLESHGFKRFKSGRGNGFEGIHERAADPSGGVE